MESNTVTLDPEVKDEWGQPAILITYRNHPDDLKNMAFFRERALELLQAAGRAETMGLASGRSYNVCSSDPDPQTLSEIELQAVF